MLLTHCSTNSLTAISAECRFLLTLSPLNFQDNKLCMNKTNRPSSAFFGKIILDSATDPRNLWASTLPPPLVCDNKVARAYSSIIEKETRGGALLVFQPWKQGKDWSKKNNSCLRELPSRWSNSKMCLCGNWHLQSDSDILQLSTILFSQDECGLGCIVNTVGSETHLLSIMAKH